MPELINRRCPQCGRKAHDRLLVQCPDCRVPFVYDETRSAELTPDQLRLVISQVFGNWKFWAALVVMVGAAAWGVTVVADRMIAARSREYLSTLQKNAASQIQLATGQISNQIALEFRQPRIKQVIEQEARRRANDVFSNNVRPSLEAFQDAVDLANSQLARASNTVAELESAAEAAKQRIPPPVVAPAPPAPVAAETPAKPAEKPPAIPAANAAVKLSLVNHTVLPAGNNYMVTFFFKVNGTPTSGMVDIMVGTFKQTARILSLASMASGSAASPMISDTGDVARLRFSVNDRDAPTLVLELSAPTIIRIVSDSLETDLTIPVAAEKMQLPALGK